MGTSLTRCIRREAIYNRVGNVMTETAIDSGLFRDLYISMGER